MTELEILTNGAKIILLLPLTRPDVLACLNRPHGWQISIRPRAAKIKLHIRSILRDKATAIFSLLRRPLWLGKINRKKIFREIFWSDRLTQVPEQCAADSFQHFFLQIINCLARVFFCFFTCTRLGFGPFNVNTTAGNWRAR